MPTYEYKCKNCSHLFEHFQSMKDAPLKKCPQCGKNALERLIGTGAAVLFKGSGFYQTDYRSEGYKAAQKAESGSSSSSGDAGASKPADAKPVDSKAESSKPAAKPAETKPKADKPAPKKK